MRWLLFGVVALPVLLFNLRLHHVPGDEEVAAQLHFLDAAIAEGAAERMQPLFPEGYFFTHLLYGLTALERIRAPDAEGAAEAIAAGLRSREMLLRPAGVAPFDPELEPTYGVFYQAWMAWLEVELLRLSGTSSAAVDRRLDLLARAFEREGPLLSAYPGQSWPCDNVVALAALSARDHLLPPRYAEVRARWIAALRAEGELLPHQTRPVRAAPRGSSQSVIQRFLPEIDPDWAEVAYPAFRRRFVTTRLGRPGVTEHEGGGGAGDVDSGPLIFGVSLSATVVGLAAARANGDSTLAEDLATTMEAAGMPIGWEQKRYALGLLPVGDAFVAWAFGTPAGAQRPYPTLPTSRGPVHGASALGLLGLAALLFRRRRTAIPGAAP